MGVQSKLLRFLRSSELSNSHDRSLSLEKWGRRMKDGNAVIICDFVPVVIWLLRAFHKGMVEGHHYPWHSYVYGGDLDDYAERLIDFVKALEHLKVKPVFFVEGPVGSHRSDTKEKMESRMRSLNKRGERAASYISYCQNKKGSRSLEHGLELKPLILRHLLQELCRSGAEVTICDGDSEKSMVQYAREHPNACGILTTNTNLTLLAGCCVLPCDLFDSEDTLQLQKPTMQKEPKDILCEKIEPDGLARTLGIDVKALPALSILCGNDYTNQYLKQQEVIDELKLPKLYTVEWACEWIKNHSCRTFHQFLHNPEIVEICDIFSGFGDAVEHTYEFDDELLDEDLEEEEEEEESSSEGTICRQGAALREKVLQKNLGIEFLPIINRGIFFQNPLDCEGSDNVYSKLCRVRKWMYSLLCIQSITEYSFSGHHRVSKISDIPPCDPDLLQKLCKLKIEQRMLVFFSVLTHGHEPLQNFLPQGLYDCALGRVSGSKEMYNLKLLFRYACLVAGYRMGIMPDIAVPTLVMSCLCSTIGLHSPRLRNLPIPSPAMVDWALQFSCLVEHAYNLASLLGLNNQLPPPSKVFKASLFIPLQMMSLKEQGPDDIADAPMVALNEKLLIFYKSITEALAVNGVMEEFHRIIQRGDEKSIADFITLFGTAKGAIEKRAPRKH